MLNEIREFEQYTYPLDTEHPSIRLKHKNICNELSGTARAMTIIARKSIFDHDGPDRIGRAKNDLQVWCGDPKGKPEKASDGIVFSWLPDYIVKHLGEEKALKFEDYLETETGLKAFPRFSEVCSLFKDIHDNFNIDTYREKDSRKELMDKAKKLSLYCKELGEPKDPGDKSRKDKPQRDKTSKAYAPVYRILKALNTLNGRYGRQGYNKKIFDAKMDRSEKNDFKKITYDKIIADAVVQGPLARYYLVCEKENFSDIEYVTITKDKITKEIKITRSEPFRERKKKKGKYEWSVPTKNKADLIMKSVAAFLLEQRFRNTADSYAGPVPINKTDIANWLAGSTGTEAINQFEINGKKLFSSEEIDNVVAVDIDNEWMKSCGWKVIPENELDQYLSEHQDAVFFSDPGAGEFLQKNVRYE